MTEAHVQEMIAEASKINMDDLVKRMVDKVDSLKTAFEECSFGNGRPVRHNAEEETGVVHDTTYMLRTNAFGEISRLPNDFQFPKAGIYDCWVQWNVGNTERQIPPMQTLGPREDGCRETVAKRKAHQQAAAKSEIFSDMKFICNYIESKAGDSGVDSSDVSLGNVRKMYDTAVKDLIIPGKQNQGVDQLKWQTMVSRVRKKLKEAKEALAADAG